LTSTDRGSPGTAMQPNQLAHPRVLAALRQDVVERGAQAAEDRRFQNIAFLLPPAAPPSENIAAWKEAMCRVCRERHDPPGLG
jgi:hypothetical protein